MGRKRSNIIMDRPLVDDYGLDRITSKVGTIAVYQGFIDGVDEFAYVQKSRFAGRQPKEIDIFAHTIRSAKQSLIFDTPEGCAWCSHCGEWRLKDRFSPDKRNRNGLHVWCKTCRNDHERKMYWSKKELMAA